ncbi:serine/threonine-protein phosphatase with EF-hands 2-like [Acipenser oxyrinchus oxyrinchus]|uniref:Serine/threonine-protein phosphatase with EF-hands n=1 Tax=Acipenser oxyrinchus oxyrinchus TaxID=40147 RepID=A0AAD8LW69_ACIOX|nr:serine/threonine-protein phosphatase with EF-hands 2-like [Acipenser oxyrinchus oxyrinchus]
MGCGISLNNDCSLKKTERAMKAAVLIQRWYRQYVARMEVRRRCTWTIFQSIEYAGEQDQIKLQNFFTYLMDHFTPTNSNQRDLISHIFTEDEVYKETELEKYFDHETIELPESYTGPHIDFPLTAAHAAALVEAFRHKQQLHARYVLQLLHETLKHLKLLPNINRVCTCFCEEITICGDLHGQLDDLLLIFYKNGLPSVEKPYIFNGDYVDRGKNSIEILLILFAFLLVYPNEVHMNRGNHEDYIVNLRYGFTKEVMQKYKMHGRKIHKLLQIVFSWMPLATVIDQKVLITHGGISDTTDLDIIAKVDRHKYVSVLRPPKKKKRHNMAEALSIRGARTSEGDIQTTNMDSRHALRRLSLTSTPCYSPGTRKRSPHDISRKVRRSVEEELEKCRRQVGFSEPYEDGKFSLSFSESDSESFEVCESDNAEWKQIVDILWSDPMHQEGCVPNAVRGGGCYYGPDVTEKVLSRHNIQLLIRSHECKQDGYEFCHNRKVLTIFSASNYYELGSNRGAYVKLGPDLIPHLVQYQVSRTTRKLTMKQRVSRVERSALRALREQLFSHKSDLISAFEKYDNNKTGRISLNDWATVVGSVLQLGLPWRVLRSQLVQSAPEGLLEYHAWFDDLAIEQPTTEHVHQSLLETLYRNRSNLETIFRIIDSDNSGLVSFEEFCQTWKLLSSHLNMEISNEAISDLARSIDFNKDGSIDINEFLEAFRLVDKIHYTEREGSLLLTTPGALL